MEKFLMPRYFISAHILFQKHIYVAAEHGKSEITIRFIILLKGGKIMNANVAIQVLPKADSDDQLISVVDEVIDYIKSTGLNYYVGPCETSIEGDYDQLMEIVKECQKVAIRAGAKEVSAYVKINYRPEGEVLTIERKVQKHHK
jgi:uncharacterized protein YqgV (UPF0045/DUF77 family)